MDDQYKQEIRKITKSVKDYQPESISLYGVSFITPGSVELVYTYVTSDGPKVISISLYQARNQPMYFAEVKYVEDLAAIKKINNECQVISYVETINIKKNTQQPSTTVP